MKVLIFHGYLLRGTGSNVYNASLARALARLGHEVHLVCQDRAAGDLADGEPGSVTIHNADIGGLLPVFVADAYEGFEVKTFAELSDTELERYVELNVAAVREVVDDIGGVDAALANHLVMGPVILARAGLGYALKVHGSDLSYTVLPDLERFGPYAEEAIEGATGVLVGSSHIADRVREAVGSLADPKMRLGPPGVDTDLFSPIDREAAPERLRRLAIGLRLGGGGTDAGDASAKTPSGGKRHHGRRNQPIAIGGAWDRDSEAAADAIEWFAAAAGPRVVFVGKLIVSKGVDLLLAAWPLVHAQNPGARLLIAGFGALESALRGVSDGLARGDLDPLRKLATRGRGLEDGPVGTLPLLTDFLVALPHDYAENARDAAGSVAFAGRLEHDEVGALVPAADALVFPSTFPEAFGMVAAEAAAAGVLPVSAAHSGALEVSRALAAELPAEVAPLVSFALEDEPVSGIAERINAWLALSPALAAEASATLRETVKRLWSWEGVARGVLDAAAGRLDQLPPVPRT